MVNVRTAVQIAENAIESAAKRIVTPVMATIKNLSTGIRSFKDKFGKDVHIHPGQSRSFPMHPGHLPMLRKEADQPKPKIELTSEPIEGDEIIGTAPRNMKRKSDPDADRRFFMDPAQTLGRPRPLVPKLSDNDPEREGAGPDFTDQSRKEGPKEDPPRAPVQGASRYDAIEDDKTAGTGRTDGEPRQTAREPRERSRKKR